MSTTAQGWELHSDPATLKLLQWSWAHQHLLLERSYGWRLQETVELPRCPATLLETASSPPARLSHALMLVATPLHAKHKRHAKPSPFLTAVCGRNAYVGHALPAGVTADNTRETCMARRVNKGNLKGPASSVLALWGAVLPSGGMQAISCGALRPAKSWSQAWSTPRRGPQDSQTLAAAQPQGNPMPLLPEMCYAPGPIFPIFG